MTKGKLASTATRGRMIRPEEASLLVRHLATRTQRAFVGRTGLAGWRKLNLGHIRISFQLDS